MSGRTNVLQALKREEPECVPTFEWDINSKVLEKLIGEIDIFKAVNLLGLDGIVVRQSIADAGKGGGYILSSSNMIHSGVRPENYKAMLEAVKRYGTYPAAVQDG